MMRVVALATLMLLPAAALAACGSSNAADLFNGSSGNDAADAAQDATGSGNPETSGTDGSAPADAGKKPDKDSGGGPKDDAASPTDSGSAPETSTYADPGIFCGNDNSNNPVYCNVATQACCIRNVGGSLAFECKPQSGSNSTCSGLRVPCSDTSDCNGQICCATYNKLQSGYDDVSCKATCNVDSATTAEYRLCDPMAPVDECEAIGATCQPSTAIDGWYLCKHP